MTHMVSLQLNLWHPNPGRAETGGCKIGSKENRPVRKKERQRYPAPSSELGLQRGTCPRPDTSIRYFLKNKEDAAWLCNSTTDMISVNFHNFKHGVPSITVGTEYKMYLMNPHCLCWESHPRVHKCQAIALSLNSIHTFDVSSTRAIWSRLCGSSP